MKANKIRLSLVGGIVLVALYIGVTGSQILAGAERKTVIIPQDEKKISCLEKEVSVKKKAVQKTVKKVSRKNKEAKKLASMKKWGQELSENPFLFPGHVMMSLLIENQLRVSEKSEIVKRDTKKLKKSLKKKRRELKASQRALSKETERKEIVFNPEDVTECSGITAEQLEKVLSGTELAKFASTYVEIEQTYGINAIAICSLSALESGWGTSKRAREDNNYTGFGVYSEDAVGINANNGEENLLMTAKHLREEYLTEGGEYNNGPSLEGINIKYCTGDTWAGKITDIGYRLMNRLEHPEAGLDENSIS